MYHMVARRRTSSDGQKKTDGRKKKSGMTGLQTMSLGLFIVVAFLTFRTLRAPMLRLFGSSNKVRGSAASFVSSRELHVAALGPVFAE